MPLPYIDINKYITITNTFLGKGVTGYNSEGKRFAVKTVWKSGDCQNECFKI